MEARLTWSGDWGGYPTNDIDLVLVPPTGSNVVTAATLNAPERATIVNPVAGQWKARVDGFSIPLGDERYKLLITLDGNVVNLR